MIVNGGQPANFIYPTFDEASGLNVAALIYDVTSGTPSLVGSAIAMTNESSGVYVGSFTPLTGKSYLVLMAVYLDSGFTTPDTSRAPSAQQYDAFTTNTTLLSFNYGAFDQNSGLAITATIYDLTDVTQSTLTMTYLALGVYFGQYQGIIGKQYAILKVPSNNAYAPGAESFQCFTITGGSSVNVITYIQSATLVGQIVTATFPGQIFIENLIGEL